MQKTTELISYSHVVFLGTPEPLNDQFTHQSSFATCYLYVFLLFGCLVFFVKGKQIPLLQTVLGNLLSDFYICAPFWSLRTSFHT